MEVFSKDVVTIIMLKLSTKDKFALLSAYPKLKVNWNQLYLERQDPINAGLKKILKKRFGVTDKERLKQARKYYDSVDISVEYGDTDFDSTIFVVPPNIYCYKLEDYIYSIEDYIYSDIYNFKLKNVN